MIISPQKYIYVKCPSCDENNIVKIDPFSICGANQEIFCSDCGGLICSFKKRKKDKFEIKLECFLCGDRHQFQLPLSAFFSQQMTTYGCDKSGLDVCYIGTRHQVEEAMYELIKDLWEEGEEDFIAELLSYELQKQILDLIKKLGKKGRILCTCNNLSLHVTFQTHQVLISCDSCGAKEWIPLTDEGVHELAERKVVLLKKEDEK